MSQLGFLAAEPMAVGVPTTMAMKEKPPDVSPIKDSRPPHLTLRLNPPELSGCTSCGRFFFPRPTECFWCRA